MDLIDRILRVIRANLNALIGQAERSRKDSGTNSYRYARESDSTGRLWLRRSQF